MKNWEAPIGYKEKKYNYTYKLSFKNDKRYYYYGVHCTNHNPYLDNYYGSGSNVKKYKELYGKDCFEKEILNFYPTKKEALLAEDELVPISLLNDEFCLNKIQGGGTFDTTGMKLDEKQKALVSERFKGKKRTLESIDKMIETRRKRGTDKQSKESREKISKAQQNRINIIKDDVCKKVKKDQIDIYLNDGWEIGYPTTRNKKIAESKIGDKNPMFGKKVSQDTKDKMLATKIKNGTNKHSNETKEKLAKLNREKAKDPEFRKRLSEAAKGKNTWSKGRVFINKNGILKTCKPEDLEKYINDGWLKGRK